MDIITVNAETKLLPVISCIGRFPKSWRGWYAMRISFQELNPEAIDDGFFCAKSIIESYLGEVEGRVYNCGQTLHILCKNVVLDILEQTGAQVRDLLNAENEVGSVNYKIYSLEGQSADYARIAEQDCNGAFFLVSTGSFLDRVEQDFLQDQILISANKTKKEPKSLQELTKVLLIEDDPVTRWMVRNSLKNECEFASASCANKAFSMYSSFNPEIVFLDINLPDNDGYSVLQWIMKNDPGACVVMFSSNSNLDNILSALERGASGFISKPFLRDNLMHYVRGNSQ